MHGKYLFRARNESDDFLIHALFEIDRWWLALKFLLMCHLIFIYSYQVGNDVLYEVDEFG
jgi:hypothetical protein